jgi:hypothetical protein
VSAGAVIWKPLPIPPMKFPVMSLVPVAVGVPSVQPHRPLIVIVGLDFRRSDLGEIRNLRTAARLVSVLGAISPTRW